MDRDLDGVLAPRDYSDDRADVQGSAVGPAASQAPAGHEVGAHEVRMLDAVGHIENVQPASKYVVFVGGIVIVGVALVLLIFELMFPFFAWDAVVERWERRGRGDPLTAAAESLSAARDLATGTAATTASKKRQPGWGKWAVLLVNVLSISALDLFYNVPGTFIAGASQERGLKPYFPGIYLASAGFLALMAIFGTASLSEYMSLTDLMRISIAFFGIVTTAQGFAPLFNATGFAVCLVVFRTLQGLPYGFIEASGGTQIFRAWPAEEMPTASAVYYTVRGLVVTSSSPFGGLLYMAGGFSLPYVAIGLLSVICVPLLRTFHRSDEHLGVPSPFGSLGRAFCVPAVAAIMFLNLAIMCVLASWDALWQPWLGVAPYAWDSARISTVAFFQGVMHIVSASIITLPLASLIGDLPVICIGLVTLIGSTLLVGSPPLVLSMLSEPDWATEWLPYLAVGLFGIGSSLAIVPLSGVLMLTLRTEGSMTQAEAAGPASIATVAAPYLGCAIGPPITGFILSSGGVAIVSLYHSCLLASASLVVLLTCCPLLCKAQDMDKELSEEEKVDVRSYVSTREYVSQTRSHTAEKKRTGLDDVGVAGGTISKDPGSGRYRVSK